MSRFPTCFITVSKWLNFSICFISRSHLSLFLLSLTTHSVFLRLIVGPFFRLSITVFSKNTYSFLCLSVINTVLSAYLILIRYKNKNNNRLKNLVKLLVLLILPGNIGWINLARRRILVLYTPTSWFVHLRNRKMSLEIKKKVLNWYIIFILLYGQWMLDNLFTWGDLRQQRYVSTHGCWEYHRGIFEFTEKWEWKEYLNLRSENLLVHKLRTGHFLHGICVTVYIMDATGIRTRLTVFTFRHVIHYPISTPGIIASCYRSYAIAFICLSIFRCK